MSATGRLAVADREPATLGRRNLGRWLLVAGLAAFGGVLAGYAVLARTEPAGWWLDPVDLIVYRDAGLIVRQVSPLYNPHLATPLYDWAGYLGLKYIYPPIAALLFALISFTPLGLLTHLWAVVSVAALLWAIRMLYEGLGYRRGAGRLGLTLLAGAAVLFTEPVDRTIYLGQIELVLMALIMWDMCQPDRRRWKGAGVGLAAGIKMVPLLFIVYLALTRRFRQAAVATAVFGATVAAGFIVLPKDSSQWWLHGLFEQGSYGGNISWAGNQSLLAIIARTGGPDVHNMWLAAAALAALLGLATAVMFDRAGHRMLGLLSAALTALLVSPISWDHHWVWIVLAVPVLGHYALRLKGAARWACVTLAVAVTAVFGAWPGSFWGEPTDLGTWSRGVIWAPPNGSDLEIRWHGWQLLVGNAYVLTGLVLFLTLLVIALRLPLRPCPEPVPRAATERPVVITDGSM